MSTKTIYVSSIFLVIICSSLISAQSPYHLNNFNRSFSINDYLISEYGLHSDSDFVKMDSLIATSVQGIRSKHLFQYNENNKMIEWLILDNFGSGWDNSFKNNLFYDNQNNLVTEINLGWSVNDWDSPGSKYIDS